MKWKEDRLHRSDHWWLGCLLGQKGVSAFQVLLAAYISFQQNEQSIVVFNQVWPFPHSVTPAPQITSRRCFYSRSTGAVRYLQPPQSLATGRSVPGEKPAQQVHQRPRYALVLWSLSGTSFRPVDAANVVCNKPTVYRNVDLYHNFIWGFFVLSLICLCKGNNKIRGQVLGCSSCTVLCFVSVWNSCIRIIKMWFAKNILNIWKRIWWHFPYKNNQFLLRWLMAAVQNEVFQLLFIQTDHSRDVQMWCTLKI